jgi:serine-type D-Ala-D-Ala carboxypeptidase/endopeptidase (penicillin-binding protein 4)
MTIKPLYRAMLLTLLAGAVIASIAAIDRKAKPTPAKQNQISKQAAVATPSPSATQSPDPALQAEIDRIIDENHLEQTRVGIFVMSLRDGRVLYSRDADKLFTPASNMKVYTTAVAVDLLGADYRWRTSIYAAKQPGANGIINGDLTLYGRGSPDLISKEKGDAPSLSRLADQIYQSGVRQVRGNIVGDESYFRGEPFGVGWQWNDLQWYFGAEPSALSIDENSIEVTIAPSNKKGSSASVVVNPNDSFVHLTNNTITAERDAPTSVGIIRELSGNDLQVWGDFPESGRAFSTFLSVHNPALWAANNFKRALVARGIKVDGNATSRDFRVIGSQEFDPQKSVEVASVNSQPLGNIVRKTNKESNNLYAELLLRTIGKERGATAPDPDPRKNRTRGDDEAGVAVVKTWLAQNGISTRGLAIHDGSGLSRLDLVTPESTARLLTAIAGTKGSTIFHDSLPIAGHDGTLAGRLKGVGSQIVAKTGSLTYVHSLSGYATTSSGEVLVFSILCNDTTVGRGAVSAIDQIAAAMVNSRELATRK